MISLLDVSHHQSRTPDLTGISGLIARVTIGTKPDETAAMHIGAARAHGLVTGAYHFNWSPLSVADQVKAFLAACARLGELDLYALDVEKDSGTSTPPFTLAQAREFIDRVHQAGKLIGLYHSLSGYMDDAGQDWRWVAAYGYTSLPIPWDIWQYGSLRGADGNRFRGSVDDLRALGRPVVQDNNTEEPVSPVIITVLPYGGGLFTVPAGASPGGLKIDPATGAVAAHKIWTPGPDTSSAHYDALVDLSALGIRGNPYVRVTDGTFAGFYVSSSEIVLNPNDRPLSDCAAAVAAQQEKDREIVLAAIAAALP